MTSDAVFGRLVRDVLAAQLPGAECETLDLALLRARPTAAAVVLDARDDVARGAAASARLRAMGFAGGIALVSDDVADVTAEAPLDPGQGEAARMGFATVSLGALADQLVPRLAQEMATADAPHAAQVMRARRLIAAGEIASRLQHSLNNPIAGLMAEAQLMQFEAVSDEQAAALQRMVALCRRLVELTRTLDGFADGKPRTR
ncbi:MAG: hypothetical protein ACHQQ3_09575 [Gemmatimonadales bacterium]